MICHECVENRYHCHSNLRPIELEKPVNLVDEAVLVYRNERVGKHPSFEATRTAIIHAVKRCAEIASSHDHDVDSIGFYDCPCGDDIAAEILKAAGLGEEKKP